MKKKVFSLLTIMFSLNMMANDSGTQTVNMSGTTSNGHNHNEIPTVTYNQDDDSMMVTTEAEGAFSLIVRDAEGKVAFAAPVIANGTTNYYAPHLEQGNMYIITVKSTSDNYIGVLTTD